MSLTKNGNMPRWNGVNNAENCDRCDKLFSGSYSLMFNVETGGDPDEEDSCADIVQVPCLLPPVRPPLTSYPLSECCLRAADKPRTGAPFWHRLDCDE